jgi:hypothetical protein
LLSKPLSFTEEKYKIHLELVLRRDFGKKTELFRDETRLLQLSTYDGKPVVIKYLLNLTLGSDLGSWLKYFNELHCPQQLGHSCILPVLGLRLEQSTDTGKIYPGIVTPFKKRFPSRSA